MFFPWLCKLAAAGALTTSMFSHGCTILPWAEQEETLTLGETRQMCDPEQEETLTLGKM